MKWLNPLTYLRDMRGVWRDYKAGALLVDLFSSIRTWIAAFAMSAAYPAWAQDTVNDVWPVVRDGASGIMEVVTTFVATP